MNFPARIPEGACAQVRLEHLPGAPSFSGFARVAPRPAPSKARVFGIIGVLALHGLVFAGYILAGPGFVSQTMEHTLVVFQLPQQPPDQLEPPPPPKLAPPPVFVPQVVLPEIQLSVPPPPAETITPPPMVAPAPIPPNAVVSEAPQPAVSGSQRAAFAGVLFSHLNKFKRYPEAARIKRQEGVVSLRFTMDRTGHVLSFAVAKTSGVTAIDQAALDLIQRAQPLPPIPSDFGRSTLELVIPIEYNLR